MAINNNSLYGYILSRAVELGGNTTDCLAFLEAIGFNFDDIKGRTITIFGNDKINGKIEYSPVLMKITLPTTREGFMDICLTR